MHTTTSNPRAHALSIATGSGLLRPGTSELLSGRSVSAVAELADGRLAALVDRRRVVVVDDSGSAVELGDLGEPAGTCIAVHDRAVWVGGDEARLWRVAVPTAATVTPVDETVVESGVEPVVSFGHAPGRADWYTPWGGPPAVFALASLGAELAVAVHVGGIVIGDGTAWRQTIDIHHDVHQVCVDGHGVLWAATGGNDLMRSDDAGWTWQSFHDGLPSHYLLAVAATDDDVLVAAATGPHADDGTIFRLDGDRFVDAHADLPRNTGAISPRRLTADRDLFAVALPDGTVATSLTAGRSWDVVARTSAVADIHLPGAALRSAHGAPPLVPADGR